MKNQMKEISEGKVRLEVVREVKWCDHVRIHPIMAGVVPMPTLVLVSNGAALLVFEENILKVVCHRCFDIALPTKFD